MGLFLSNGNMDKFSASTLARKPGGLHPLAEGELCPSGQALKFTVTHPTTPLKAGLSGEKKSCSKAAPFWLFVVCDSRFFSLEDNT